MLLVALVVGLALLHLSSGPVHIPFTDVLHSLLGSGADERWTTIVRDVRLPSLITAILAGAGLAACGLMMQTLFRNPLAGPSVLGLSTGGSLGVAVVMLAAPFWQTLPIASELMRILGALAGAGAVLLVILLADRRVGDGLTLLIIGLMLGHLAGALVSVLQVSSPASALKGFVIWGMGSFAGVGPSLLPWLVLPVLVCCALVLLLAKPLNALLLGADYARSMGTDAGRSRLVILVVTGVLVGVITAFCGPIAFIGVATPHVARGLFRTSDHNTLLPATLLCGACIAVFCDIIVRLPQAQGQALPLNAVTSLLGAPVVAWVLLSGRRWSRAS